MTDFSTFTRSQLIARLKARPHDDAARAALEALLREGGDIRGAKIQSILRRYVPCPPQDVTEAERRCIIETVADYHDRDISDLVLVFEYDEDIAVWTFVVGDRHTDWEDDTFVLLAYRGDLKRRTLRAWRVR